MKLERLSYYIGVCVPAASLVCDMTGFSSRDDTGAGASGSGRWGGKIGKFMKQKKSKINSVG